MNLQSQKIIFVTVGSTEFEELIQAIDCVEVYQAFIANGYTKLFFQIGR